MLKEFAILKDFFKENRLAYGLGLIWLLAVDLFQLITPRLLGLFTDTILTPGATMRDLSFYLGLLLFFALLAVLGRYYWRIYILGTSRLLEQHLRERLFRQLQVLSPGFYNRHKTGDLMAHATNDLTAVRTSLGISIIMAVDAVVLTLVALVLMLLTVDVRLTLIALAPYPLLAVVSQKLGKGVYQRFLGVQKAFGELTDTTRESMAGIRVVQAFAAEKNLRERFEQAAHNHLSSNINLLRLWALFDPVIFLTGTLSFLAALVLGGNLVLQGEISLGDLVAFNSYLALLTWPMLALGWVVNITQRGKASMSRLNNLLHETPEIKDGPQTLSVCRLAHTTISLQDVSFGYDTASAPVLHNLSMTIPEGTNAALAGMTGSGKSTLVYLILRFYAPHRGEISLGGYPLHLLPLSLLRKTTGYVPQDNFLFSRSIRENIIFGRPHATPGEIEEAVFQAGLKEEISSFPEGLDTVLGERGLTLSGGQQQRVALARALLVDPPILIIDDAFSALDTSKIKEIMSALKKRRQGKTTLFITHRPEVLDAVDYIYMMEKGAITEEGRHDELYNKKTSYYHLYKWHLQNLQGNPVDSGEVL